MERALVETMLSFSSEPCIVLDRDMNIFAGNDLARTAFGLTAGTAAVIDLADQVDVTSRLLACFHSTAPTRFGVRTSKGRQLNLCGWRLSGTLRSLNLIAVKIEDAVRIKSEFVSMTIARQSDIQRSKRLHAQKRALEQRNRDLAALARTDRMTGLLNATGLRRVLRQTIESGKSFALFYIDMNGLKLINDSLGHGAGDQAIMALADAIRANSRQTDVGARIGGDEFALLVPDVASNRVLRDIGKAIAATLSQHIVTLPDDRAVRLSAAVGVARYPEDGMTVSAIESMADQAMYACKRASLTTVIAGDAIMQTLSQSSGAGHDAKPRRA